MYLAGSGSGFSGRERTLRTTLAWCAPLGIASESLTADRQEGVRYTKEALRDVPLDTVIKIAEDLGLEQEIRAAHGVSTAPRNWQGTNKFRLFISHIAKH